MNKDYLYDLYREFRHSKKVQIPDITIQDGSKYDYYWAQVRNADLQSSEYIVYINPDLYCQNEDFIKMTAWHEFTHISDSIYFADNFNEKDFNTLMSSYSEFHATYESTLYMLKNNKYTPPKLPNPDIMSIDNYSKILAYDYIETIWKAYMKKAKRHEYICKEMYYYFGYAKAVRKFDRQYETSLSFYRLPPDYIDTVRRLYVALTQQSIDCNKIIKCANDFNNMIVNVHK